MCSKLITLLLSLGNNFLYDVFSINTVDHSMVEYHFAETDKFL